MSNPCHTPDRRPPPTPTEAFAAAELQISQILERLEKETHIKVSGLKLDKVRNALGSTICIGCKIEKENEIPVTL